MQLEPTYTAKAFAAALELVQQRHPAAGRAAHILYWHTFNAVDQRAETLPLPPELARLFIEAN